MTAFITGLAPVSRINLKNIAHNFSLYEVLLNLGRDCVEALESNKYKQRLQIYGNRICLRVYKNLHLLRSSLKTGNLRALLPLWAYYGLLPVTLPWMLLAAPFLPAAFSPQPASEEFSQYRPAKDIDAFNNLLPPPIEFVEGSSTGALAAADGKYEPINRVKSANTEVS